MSHELPPNVSQAINDLVETDESARARYYQIALRTIAFFGQQPPFDEKGYNFLLTKASATFGETNEDFAVIVSVASHFARKVLVEGVPPAQVGQDCLPIAKSFTTIVQ
jgi:hypothetical protein